jgi:DGQHR domain-containing protein
MPLSFEFKEILTSLLLGEKLSTGHQCLVGTITLATLSPRLIVPIRDPITRSGYQRVPGASRIARYAKSLVAGKSDLVLPLLLNIRESRNCLSKVGSDGLVTLNKARRLYIVDGQHRYLAAAKAAELDPENWANIKVPVTIVLGLSEQEEAQLFLSVNSNAKRIRTDLARDLIAQYDPNVSDIVRISQALTRKIATDSELWKGRIGFEGKKFPDKLIGNAAFGDSLHPWLKIRLMQGATFKSLSAELKAFWCAVEECLPECFEFPKEFGIQKQTGVVVLHRVLAGAVGPMASRGLNLSASKNYKVAINPALLSPRGTTRNRQSRKQAVDFWRVGDVGMVGTYSSKGGQAKLARIILAQLDWHD